MSKPEVSEKEILAWIDEVWETWRGRCSVSEEKEWHIRFGVIRSLILDYGRFKKAVWDLKQEVGLISDAAIRYWFEQNTMVGRVLNKIRDFDIEGGGKE